MNFPALLFLILSSQPVGAVVIDSACYARIERAVADNPGATPVIVVDRPKAALISIVDKDGVTLERYACRVLDRRSMSQT